MIASMAFTVVPLHNLDLPVGTPRPLRERLCPSGRSRLGKQLHGLSWAIPGQAEKQPIIQRSESQTPIYCHPKDVGNPFTGAHAVKAAELHNVLVSIPRANL
jgi:hypothetical protein